MDINKKIEKLRFERGWSMYELAQEAGITQSTLTSMIKRGNPPKIETLECIGEAFDFESYGEQAFSYEGGKTKCY